MYKNLPIYTLKTNCNAVTPRDWQLSRPQGGGDKMMRY